MESVWTKAFLLEMKVADIISRQAKHGTQFNYRQCQWLIHTLNEKITVIDHELVPMLPMMLNKGTSYAKPFLKSGGFAKYPGAYAERVGLKREEVGGPFTAVWYTPFDTGKTDKVKTEMFNMGWIPTEWNSKKMPFQTYRYRKRLQRISYKEFISEWDPVEAQEMDTLVQGYINNHFTGRSRGYMKALVQELGFRGKKAPTFDAIKKRLISNPFWPTSAKITEESFDSLPEGSRLGLLLKQRGILSHRRSFLKGLIEKYRERGDGKLSGEAISCATPTARMKHRVIVNVPASGSPLGKQCRGLFFGDFDESVTKPTIVKTKVEALIEKGDVSEKDIDYSRNRYFYDGDWHHLRDYIPAGQQVFVGYDGAGLELRMLAHYMIHECQAMLDEGKEENNDAKIQRAEVGLKSALEYREVLLNGDIHTHNQKLAGLPTRKAAKSFIYGFNYGAGNAKLGELVNGGAKEGEIIRETFLRENPCIAILIERMQEKGKSGYLIALDGRKLILRVGEDGAPQTHKALNLLLQSAGAIVMKYAMCFLDNWAKGLKAKKVLDIHDEGQWTCHPEDMFKLACFMGKCVAKAGEHLNMQCPLSSDAMIGKSWYSTH